MTLHIELKDGKWLVNGNPYNAMTMIEKEFFHGFMNEVRISKNVEFCSPLEIIKEVKRLVDKIDINDPAFHNPTSDLEKNYNE